MSDKQTLSPRKTLFFLHYKDAKAIASAYMPYLKNGGIFIPTRATLKLGKQVFLLLRFLEEPGQIALTATVVWVAPPECQQNMSPGIGVRFDDRESKARGALENYLPDKKNPQDSFVM